MVSLMPSVLLRQRTGSLLTRGSPPLLLFPERVHKSLGVCEDSTSPGKPDAEAYDVKQKLFEAALPFVSSDGWSRQAVVKGAKAAGLPSVAHGLFGADGVDLAAYFYLKCNGDLHDWMLERKQATVKESTSSFVEESIRHRLRMVEPYENCWPQAMGLLLSSPRTGAFVMRDLIDDIWHVAGDESVDMKWYSKRLALAAVYESTQLFLLQDKSSGKAETWAFLTRQVRNIFGAASAGRNFGSAASASSSVARGLSLSVKNMLGLNHWFR